MILVPLGCNAPALHREDSHPRCPGFDSPVTRLRTRLREVFQAKLVILLASLTGRIVGYRLFRRRLLRGCFFHPTMSSACPHF